MRERRDAAAGTNNGQARATTWCHKLVAQSKSVAAHHAQVLMEAWLAGAPVLEIRVMLSSLAGDPEQQPRIEAL